MPLLTELCFDEMKENYSKTRQEIDRAWERVYTCERNTVEKIHICEELLKQKVEKKYVDTEITNLKEYLKK